MIRNTRAAIDDGQFRRDLDGDGRLTMQSINDALSELNLRRSISQKLGEYYTGENPTILSRKIPEKTRDAPDNRIAVSYARKLINTVVGYMFKPGLVQYGSGNDAYKTMLDGVFWDNGEHSKTARIGKLMSIFGVAYEIHYTEQRDGGPAPRFAPIPTEDFIPVYSHDVEPKLVAGIHRYVEDRASDRTGIEHVDIYYADVIQEFLTTGTASTAQSLTPNGDDYETEHGYGMVPVAVYRNNDEIAGDYEHVMKLIDAYDILMSDSMNEFDRFAWAYLLLRNISMSKDDVEDAKRKRVIEIMGENGGVEFLTKQVQTEFIEFMRKWIREEIHKQTHIPDMADEQFAGQQSGIAIRYKLNDLENIASVKEIGFREGLRRRLDLLNAFWRTQGRALGDTRDIDIMMQRNVPENFLEQAQIVGQLRGHVSHKSLLDHVVGFVDDAQAEMDALQEEQDVLFGGDDVQAEEETEE